MEAIKANFRNSNYLFFLLLPAGYSLNLVFIHFTASWCVPSLAMNSCIEELATTYQNIQFLVVDVDDVKDVASKMKVKAMPTFILMKDGETIDRFVGANPDETKKRIEACLGPQTIDA